MVVHVRATGICGSDCHFWKHGRIGNAMVVRDECGSGHESSGEVFAVGAGVTEWKVGDRVAIEAGVSSFSTCWRVGIRLISSCRFRAGSASFVASVATMPAPKSCSSPPRLTMVGTFVCATTNLR